MISYRSINQKNASLATRENLFHSAAMSTDAPSVFLQTCNRMEVYYGDGDVPVAVARHLFRVVSGLESALIGERAVQGQVKEAYMNAKAKHKLPAEMNKLFEFALQVGKRVRTETEISHGAVSHSLAAIETIEDEHIDLSNAHITIIGVNKLTADILKFLKNKGAKTVFLANRSQEKAHQLADPLGIPVVSLSEKDVLLKNTDILISATSAPHTIVNAEDVKGDKKLLAIDLAFPRDIDAKLGNRKGVTLYNIRDVEKKVQKNISIRTREVAKAEQIIEEEIDELNEVLERRRHYLQHA